MEDPMSNSTKWFGWLCLIMPFHMIEQLIFGIDELAMIRRVLSVYYGWFADPDYGIVLLVAVVGSLVGLLAFLIDRGGNGRCIALGVFGLLGVGEVHHLVETIAAWHYTPGSVTAIPYIVFGVLLLRAVVREWQGTVARIQPDASLAVASAATVTLFI
jgi:hypothetical protein